MLDVTGTGVALVTPFKKDLSIDIAALQNVVEHAIKGGVDYLVVLGTTGESVTLSKVEKELVMQTVSLTNAGRLPLVVGVGGNNTLAVAEEIKRMDFLDYEGILSVVPSYNKPTQEGIYQHFKKIAEHSPLPIILYNVPSRTGVNMLPQTTLRLANNFSNIIAIKEASGDLLQLDEIIKAKPDYFQVLSGDDFTALPTILAGGSGVISVIGQALPHEFSKMVNHALNGESESAYALHQAMLEGMKLCFEEGNPAGVKAFFAFFDICEASVRLPLVEASEQLQKKIRTFSRQLQSIKV